MTQHIPEDHRGDVLRRATAAMAETRSAMLALIDGEPTPEQITDIERHALMAALEVAWWDGWNHEDHDLIIDDDEDRPDCDHTGMLDHATVMSTMMHAFEVAIAAAARPGGFRVKFAEAMAVDTGQWELRWEYVGNGDTLYTAINHRPKT